MTRDEIDAGNQDQSPEGASGGGGEEKKRRRRSEGKLVKQFRGPGEAASPRNRGWKD